MSAPKRFFTDTVDCEVILEGEEFQHAKNVLRLTVGDEVTLLDGSGKEYPAVIAAVQKRSMLLHVVGEHVCDKEPRVRVLLLVGALKGDKTELVVQKAAELGVAEIGVFSSEYCAAYMNENKLERLRKVAKEAAKQCLRATVPEVKYYPTLKEALSSAEGYDRKLFACEFLPKSEGALVGEGSAALVVGSEGGFTEEEFACAKSFGFTGISLGRRILRAETAAIALTAAVMYASGEWE